MAPWTPERAGDEHEVVPGELGDEALRWPDTSGELDNGVGEGLLVGEGAVEDAAEEDVGRILGACECGLSTRESAELLASAEECALNCALNEFSNVH